jgi:hypothetical protein
MRGDTKLWLPERKSIVGHLARSSFVKSPTNGKLMLISYRFAHEATNIISYRFLLEATGIRAKDALFCNGRYRVQSGIVI